MGLGLSCLFFDETLSLVWYDQPAGNVFCVTDKALYGNFSVFGSVPSLFLQA